MRAIRWAAALAALAGTLSTGPTAHAQGFALERYEPPPAGAWFFGVNHPWYSSTRWFAGGITLDYAHNPLLAGVFDAQGNFHKIGAVVEHAFYGHIDVAVRRSGRVGP